jgi:hypothetical protein
MRASKPESHKSKLEKVQSLLTFSLWLHAVWLLIFVVLILFGPYEQRHDLPGWISWCTFCGSSVDRIAAASELGKLDLVSISLTILGVIIGLAALGSFGLIKGAAKDAAADEAIEWLEKKMPILVSPEVVKSAILQDRIILTLANEVKSRISDEGDLNDADADEIARSVDENEQEL